MGFISDWLEDNTDTLYVILAVVCGLVTLIVCLILKPQLWYVWLLAAAFAAWAFPAGILLFLMIVDKTIWGFIHPRKAIEHIVNFFNPKS